MRFLLSVIICTHNPKRHYLSKVLESLQFQTLSHDVWELLLIDNASQTPLNAEIDLSWHPNARHIREDQLGLTPARLRGIHESTADTLVFVDDDNILEPDYLEAALIISKDWAKIGAWSGQVKPVFEQQPPDWTKLYWTNLAIREFDQDRWSNLPNHAEAIPCGAGLCMRRAVALKYAEMVKNDPKRAGMDRKGKLLTSGGDTDMALTACDMGLGMGQFTALKLHHIMPAQRLQEDYLLRLEEGLNYSGIVLRYLRGEVPSVSWSRQAVLFCKRYLMDARTRRFHDAAQRGIRLALREIARQA